MAMLASRRRMWTTTATWKRLACGTFYSGDEEYDLVLNHLLTGVLR